MSGDGYIPNAGELTPRLHRAKPIDLGAGVARVEEMTFPWEANTFLFRFPGGAPATDSIKVGIGRLDDSGNPGSVNNIEALTEILDPVDFPVVTVPVGTRKVYVFINGIQAGLTLEVTALKGFASPSMVSRIAGAVTQARVTMGWGAPALVAVGLGDTLILAANGNRVAWKVKNTGPVQVAIRPAAVAAVFANDFILDPGDVWQEPEPGRLVTTSEIRGIANAAGAEVRVVEAT